jgi:hypothetical protein
MPLSLDNLRRASLNYQGQRARSLTEAKAFGIKSGFLSHSHKDADLAKGLVTQLRGAGLDIYIDWEDTDMPAQPNRETADRIRRKIVTSDLFLFLATPNSMASRWCPWEIGYADGKKPSAGSIVVITTRDSYSTYGNEYLQLYRRIDETLTGNLQVFEAGGSSGRSLMFL